MTNFQPDPRAFAGCDPEAVKAAIRAIGPVLVDSPEGKGVSGRAWYNLLAYSWVDLHRWASK